jgi:hypothetical protein
LQIRNWNERPSTIAQLVGLVRDDAIDEVESRRRNLARLESDQAWQLVAKILRIDSVCRNKQVDTCDEKEE